MGSWTVHGCACWQVTGAKKVADEVHQAALDRGADAWTAEHEAQEVLFDEGDLAFKRHRQMFIATTDFLEAQQAGRTSAFGPEVMQVAARPSLDELVMQHWSTTVILLKLPSHLPNGTVIKCIKYHVQIQCNGAAELGSAPVLRCALKGRLGAR